MADFINKIELCGIVGNSTISQMGAFNVARFSLLVESTYKCSEHMVVESTWFNCTAWQGEKIKDVSILKRGNKIHLHGKVQMQYYEGNDGVRRPAFIVLCSDIEDKTNEN